MDDGVISEAKREVSLVDFLERELQVTPVAKQSGYRFSSCPHCGPSESGSMKLSVRHGSQSYHCFGCMGQRESYSVVDACVAMYHLDPIEAAKKLLRDIGTLPPPKPRPVPAKVEADLDPVISEVTLKIFDALQGRKNDQVTRYLMAERKIHPHVIEEFHKRGILAFMPPISMHAKGMLEKHVGKDLMVQAGMWNPDKKAPAIAFRPMVSFFPGHNRAEFRLIKDPREGEPKGMRYGADTYPWYFEQDSSDTAIVEGIIDAMSLLSLGWNGSIIGIPGVNSWKAEWFSANARKRGVKRFFSFFDNDNEKERKGLIKNPGAYWTNVLDAALQKEGLIHVPCQPKSGDLNDLVKRGASLSELLSSQGQSLKAA